MSVLLLSGSPSSTSRTTALLRLVGEHLHVEHTLLQVRNLPPAPLLAADTTDPNIATAVEQVLTSDAIIIGSPIYKAAYTGLLKAFLDLLPQFALRNTQVLPLATGGTPAHVLAIDYALRPVLVSLGAEHVSQGWFVLDKAISTTQDGHALSPEAAELLWPVVESFARRALPACQHAPDPNRLATISPLSLR